MSLLPRYFNDWKRMDDFYDPLDHFFDSSFGLGIDPFSFRNACRMLPNYHYTPTGYRRNWMLKDDQRQSLMDKKSTVQASKEGFQVSLDVQQFAPKEITVKTVENTIVIEGRHEEKQDDHGYISRQFVRRYLLPKEYDVKDVVSTLSSDGVLTIKAPPIAKAVEQNERVIEIQQTGPAHLSVKDNSQPAADL